MLKLWEWYDANKKLLIGGIIAAGIVVAGFSWYVGQRDARENEAGEELTRLMFSPQPNKSSAQVAGEFSKIAAKYQGTQAAQRAQLQAAAALFNDSQYQDALTQFQKFLSDNSGSTDALAASAQLGVAACLESLDKKTEATAAYQKVSGSYAGTTSAEIAKQALARLSPPATPAAPAAPVKS